MESKLETEMVKLITDELYLQSQLQDVKNKIKKQQILIQKQCEHEWITERECCMYGESFTFCRKCNISA